MSYRQYEIRRYTENADDATRDRVVLEEPLEISVQTADGICEPFAVTMRTPGDDEALAAGFLRGEGVITGPDQLQEIDPFGEPSPDSGLPNQIRVRLGADVVFDRRRLRRNVYATSSCGVCGKASLEALEQVGVSRVAATMSLSASALRHLPARLLEHQATFARTGGLHAAAAVSSCGTIEDVREDVGRHNALDKLLGAALLRREAAPAAVLVSGRAGYELVQKCAASGVEMLAAIGAPSSLSVDAASRFNLTLIGFLSSARFNVYTGAHRIR